MEGYFLNPAQRLEEDPQNAEIEEIPDSSWNRGHSAFIRGFLYQFGHSKGGRFAATVLFWLLDRAATRIVRSIRILGPPTLLGMGRPGPFLG